MESAKLRKIAELESKKAQEQRALAEQQRQIAEAQTKKVIELQRKAEQQAADEQEINKLTRQLSDDLNKKNVDGVIESAKTLVAHYQKKTDPRGEFESQTILATAYLQSGKQY